MTTQLTLRAPEECRYDALALGEVMLRLDPGELRIRTARTFAAWEGGGEYNVVRGLSRVFGQRAGVITALVDDEVGHLIEGLVMAGGVDTSLIEWAPSDGVGRTVRNGLNFTERGFGVRGAKGVNDRGHTAIAQLGPDAIDFDHIFGTLGVRWLHTGGIYAALSETSAATALAAMKSAKKHGTIVSYDLNYRPSLWKSIGGQERAQQVNRELAQYVDVMIGNEEDFTASLGFEIEGVDENLTELPIEGFARMIETAAATFPNFQVIATTLRAVHSASDNDWSALAWSPSHRPGAGRRPQASGDPGPGRRWRLVRVRPVLRPDQRAGPADRRRIRCRPRRPGHDHPRRHHHGHQGRSAEAGRRRQRPSGPVTR